MAVAIVSVLPLLMARLAVERAELRQVDAKLRLMGAAVEEANELIVIVSRDGQHSPRESRVLPGGRLRAGRPDRPVARRWSSPTNRSRSSKMSKKVTKGQAWNGTLVHRRNDGSTFQAACAIVPLTNDTGQGDALRADGARHHRRASAARPAHPQRAAVGGRTARVGRRARAEQPAAVDSRLHRAADRRRRAARAAARPRAGAFGSDSRRQDRPQPAGVRPPLVFRANHHARQRHREDHDLAAIVRVRLGEHPALRKLRRRAACRLHQSRKRSSRSF